jgi:hypothetical protein
LYSYYHQTKIIYLPEILGILLQGRTLSIKWCLVGIPTLVSYGRGTVPFRGRPQTHPNIYLYSVTHPNSPVATSHVLIRPSGGRSCDLGRAPVTWGSLYLMVRYCAGVFSRSWLVIQRRHFLSKKVTLVTVDESTAFKMPVRVEITPPPPANSKQPGVTKSLLYNGSKFQGFQKSKGNSYEVEVVLQVRTRLLSRQQHTQPPHS